MRLSLLPKFIAHSITDLSPALLRSQNIRLLMLDFDNTIMPYTAQAPTKEVLDYLQCLQESDISVCVVSNSRKPRVPEFCEMHGLACITRARKPLSKGIKQCISQFGIAPTSCALAGDQIYTDVLGANLAGVQSILVQAIDNHNFWLKLRHTAELPFIFAARKRRIRNEKY